VVINSRRGSIDPRFIFYWEYPGIKAQIDEDYMRVTYRGKHWLFEKPLTVLQVLKHVDLIPENVLVIRDGKLLTEDKKLMPGDEIKIVSVISGG
jgi:sulfur carrier protein ThiS